MQRSKENKRNTDLSLYYTDWTLRITKSYHGVVIPTKEGTGCFTQRSKAAKRNSTNRAQNHTTEFVVPTTEGTGCFTQRSKAAKRNSTNRAQNHTTELSSRRRRELAVCFAQRSKESKVKKKLTNKSLTNALGQQFMHLWP